MNGTDGIAVAEPEPTLDDGEAPQPATEDGQEIATWILVLYDDGQTIYVSLDEWPRLMMAFDKKLVTEVRGVSGMHIAVDGARIKYMRVENGPALDRLREWSIGVNAG